MIERYESYVCAEIRRLEILGVLGHGTEHDRSVSRARSNACYAVVREDHTTIISERIAFCVSIVYIVRTPQGVLSSSEVSEMKACFHFRASAGDMRAYARLLISNASGSHFPAYCLKREEQEAPGATYS